MIYAFFNMDNQGWGTREGPKIAAAVDDSKVTLPTLSPTCAQVTPMGLLTNIKMWFTSKLNKQPMGAMEAHRDVELNGVSAGTQTWGTARETQTEDAPKEEEKPKMLKDLHADESRSFADKFELGDGHAEPFDKYEEVFWKKMCGPDYLKPLEYTDDEKEEIR